MSDTALMRLLLVSAADSAAALRAVLRQLVLTTLRAVLRQLVLTAALRAVLRHLVLTAALRAVRRQLVRTAAFRAEILTARGGLRHIRIRAENWTAVGLRAYIAIIARGETLRGRA